MLEQISPTHIGNNLKISVIDKDDNGNDECTKKDEVKESPAYLTMFVSELIGTAMLMFLGCMGCITKFDNPPAVHHMSGINFGMVVMLIIQTFGHISGAHLNPVVTLAALLLKQLKPVMSIVYIIAQFIGAALGFSLLKILMPEEYIGEGFCTTVIHEKITVIQGLGIEIAITTILILVCCAVWDKRNADKSDSLPLKFGFIVAAISMAAGPLTGASMNTARSFAPLLYTKNWTNQWIYLIGPNLGAPLGCGLYIFFFSIPDKEIVVNNEDICVENYPNNNAEKV